MRTPGSPQKLRHREEQGARGVLVEPACSLVLWAPTGPATHSAWGQTRVGWRLPSFLKSGGGISSIHREARLGVGEARSPVTGRF